MKRMISLLLCMPMLFGALTGCSLSGNTLRADSDLMSGVQPQALNEVTVSVSGENSIKPADFAVRLFQSSLSADENTMISPVSVLYALSMTANGAKGETLAQMEEVFGMRVDELNAYLKAYMDSLPEDEKYKLSIANSIWLSDDDRFSAKQNFLQTNADYYGADIFKVPFDNTALKNMNSWVKSNTDGMIQNILDKISPDAVMYLINAIAFDAEWKEIYKDVQIHDGIFTAEDGTEKNVEMMHSEEYLYLADKNAIGFIKPYADSKYAFVALLPDEGIRCSEYISAMTGESLASLLANPQQATVYAAIPKFENEYRVEMSEILSSMGMKNAFDEDAADFSNLGTSTAGNIFINRVIHKTLITVDEKGTKAGAATVVGMTDGAARIEDFKKVVLDRPFVYMIIDCEANLPLFIGTMMDMK